MQKQGNNERKTQENTHNKEKDAIWGKYEFIDTRASTLDPIADKWMLWWT